MPPEPPEPSGTPEPPDTPEPSDTPKRTIAVIDGNSLLHRAFHAVSATMTAPDGTPTNAVFGFMQMLLKLIEDHRPDGIVCAWDTHRPEWRMKLLEGYKAQRPKMDPALAAQFPIIEGLLESMNIPNVKLDGYEGDDILGTFAARGEASGTRVYLITGDKDAYQLASDTTTIVTTRKGMSDIVLYDPDAVRERYGIGPELVPDFLGLKGDSSDNIPGVPGVGEKKAAALLLEYGSLDGIYEHADEIKGKLGENVREHEDDARVSRAVATIRRDAPVEIDLGDVKFPDFDPARVREAFGALHFNRHLASVLSLAGAGSLDATDGSEGAAGPMGDGPAVKLSYHLAADAARFVRAALDAGRAVAVAVDVPAEQTLFDDSPVVFVFSDGAGLASATADEAVSLVGEVLSRGTLVAFDVKAVLRELAADTDSAPPAPDPAHIFDASLAAYLLDAGGTHTVAGLAAAELCITAPTGEGAPTEGQFEAAALAALRVPLSRKLEADGAMGLYRDMELPLVGVLLDLEMTGVAIDTGVLGDISAQIEGRIDELHASIIDAAGEDFNVDSPSQLGHILFDVLGCDTSKTKKTKNGSWSTNATILAKLAVDHPICAQVIEYRELRKLGNTYLDALPALVSPVDGRIHTRFNQAVTATGRLSSSEPNLQNIPVRTDLGRLVRTAFVAPAGGVILSADYSQIELRILAHLSGDPGLIAAFASGEDFHAHTASAVFKVPVEEVTPQMRSRAKAVNFGIIYGQGAFGLGQSLHIPLAEAQEMIDAYYTAYPGVRAYLDSVVRSATENGYAETMFGRKRHIPELASRNANTRHFGERTAMNHPMQGSAADIIKLAMTAVRDRMCSEGLSAKMVLQVHDELDFECPDAEVDALTEIVTDEMEGVAELSVPLVVDVACGENWAIAH